MLMSRQRDFFSPALQAYRRFKPGFRVRSRVLEEGGSAFAESANLTEQIPISVAVPIASGGIFCDEGVAVLP
ncbi:MAG: hypothetical protein BWX80_04176 [Candidatus Hydrogenedentes bacterium ADurb.Bin101]|nr:MAG: hypothetical protein BWX80_04176 [Candidatus Hydrogenedentes bacterium ADurb.Bin101]